MHEFTSSETSVPLKLNSSTAAVPRELDLGAKCVLLFAQLSGFKIDLRMTHGDRGRDR